MAMAKQSSKEEKGSTQKHLLSNALLDIRGEVTREDRDKCALFVNRSRRTVNEYCNGHVYDIAIGFKVLTYLKEQIKQRLEGLT